MSQAAPAGSPRNDPGLDGPRLLARLAELAAVGAEPSGGVSRLAYSAADVAGRDLVASWMAAAGLVVEVDAACNLIGRLEPPPDAGAGPARAKPLVVGSHLDTVVDGGRLDGAYGVVAAVEAVAALTAAGHRWRHPVAVVAFANEEGAGGTDGFDGSRAIAGRPNPLDGTDRHGVSLGRRLDGAGGRSGEQASAAWPGPVAAFLELHIEQGPVLDEAGIPLGVVTGITGRRSLDVVIEGRANHAGTTPMDLRRDALVAAARAILAVEAVAGPGQMVRVATTGTVEVWPDVRNVVPGRARLGVDLRDLDDTALDRAVAHLREVLAGIAAATGTDITVTVDGIQPPAPADEGLMAVLEESAGERGLAHTRLASGAGHDAQVMAALGPMAMLFVPSRHGVSHSPREHTDAAHLVAGAEVLALALARLDQRAG
ncbi:MAG: M20 family metallo-hydrolase [Acidimicrobiales bacterium]